MISNSLYLSKDIEKWGFGIRRIHEECDRMGVKVGFQPLKTGFMTVFYRRPAQVEGLGEMFESCQLMRSMRMHGF